MLRARPPPRVAYLKLLSSAFDILRCERWSEILVSLIIPTDSQHLNCAHWWLKYLRPHTLKIQQFNASEFS